MFVVVDGKSIFSHPGDWKVGVANAVLVDVVEKQLFGLELMKSGNLATNLREQDVAWRLSYIENLDCLVIKALERKHTNNSQMNSMLRVERYGEGFLPEEKTVKIMRGRVVLIWFTSTNTYSNLFSRSVIILLFVWFLVMKQSRE